MKKTIVCITSILTMLFGIALFSCTNNEKETTLSLTTWQRADGDLVPWWNGLIAEFEAAHPGVTIQATDLSRDTYAETLLSQFVAGSPPDIVHLASFEFAAFSQRGLLQELDSYAQKDSIDLNQWAGQRVLQVDGVNYGVMLLYFGFNLYYNDALLQAAGITGPPATWDEYIAAAQKLTLDSDRDGIIDQYGVGFQTAPGPGQYITGLLNVVLDSGAYWTDASGNITIDTPQMAQAFGKWKTIVQNSYTPRGTKINDIRQLFNEGKVAMLLEGPWMWGISRKAAPAVLPNIKIALSPMHPPVGGSSNGLGMPAALSDKKKALVWDFIKLAISKEWQTQYMEAGQTSARPDIKPNAKIRSKVPVIETIIAAKDAAAAAKVDRLPAGLEVVYNDFARLVQDQAEKMIQEDSDPATVVKDLAAMVEKLQTENQ